MTAPDPEPEGAPGMIYVSSGVAFRTRRAFVDLRWGGLRGQLSAEEARAHAMALLTAAEAAEHDAGMMRALDLPEEQAAKVLYLLRQARNANAGSYAGEFPIGPIAGVDTVIRD